MPTSRRSCRRCIGDALWAAGSAHRDRASQWWTKSAEVLHAAAEVLQYSLTFTARRWVRVAAVVAPGRLDCAPHRRGIRPARRAFRQPGAVVASTGLAGSGADPGQLLSAAWPWHGQVLRCRGWQSLSGSAAWLPRAAAGCGCRANQVDPERWPPRRGLALARATWERATWPAVRRAAHTGRKVRA